MTKPKTIDVHAHFLPPVYQEALRDAGLKTLDGGIPTPTWSPERALAIMDEVGITDAVLSVSSPHLNFVEPARAIMLARSIDDYAAEALAFTAEEQSMIRHRNATPLFESFVVRCRG
jgi:hypothetical protein